MSGFLHISIVRHFFIICYSSLKRIFCFLRVCFCFALQTSRRYSKLSFHLQTVLWRQDIFFSLRTGTVKMKSEEGKWNCRKKYKSNSTFVFLLVFEFSSAEKEFLRNQTAFSDSEQWSASYFFNINNHSNILNIHVVDRLSIKHKGCCRVINDKPTFSEEIRYVRSNFFLSCSYCIIRWLNVCSFYWYLCKEPTFNLRQ